ncbi:MAG: ATP-dependent helicase, partial [Myxococcales bacterium]
GEPLLDLLRRIMDVCGLDVELASSMSPAAAARRENLDLFIKAVADFQAVDGSVTLGALNAWLDTEDDYGGGLDLAAPSESDAVKLLTVHRAKGLEYDVVHLIGVGKKKFPNETLRPQWTTSCKVLPSRLRGDRDHVPQAPGYTADDIAGAPGSLEHQAREHQAAEELRLGYVAFTRSRHDFTVSSHAWAPSPKTEILPSPYQDVVVEFLRELLVVPDPWWVTQPGDTNPYLDAPTAVPWPTEAGGEARQAREQAAALVRAAADVPGPDPTGLSPEEQALVDVWDDELDRLVTEARQNAATDVVTVPLPASLSATALQRLASDPSAFARAVAERLAGSGTVTTS